MTSAEAPLGSLANVTIADFASSSKREEPRDSRRSTRYASAQRSSISPFKWREYRLPRSDGTRCRLACSTEMSYVPTRLVVCIIEPSGGGSHEAVAADPMRHRRNRQGPRQTRKSLKSRNKDSESIHFNTQNRYLSERFIHCPTAHFRGA